MSGFSGGSFSFSRSGSRSGRRGFLGHSHSSGRRGHYVQGGHYRQVRKVRRAGCLGAFLVGLVLVGSGVAGVTLGLFALLT